MFRSSIRPAVLCAVLAAAALAASAAPAQQAATPPAPANTGPHVVKLTNSGNQAVTAIYYAQPGTLNWSDDLLGSQTAGPGRTVTLKIKDEQGGCVFDLQFLMNDGATVNRKSVNVCESATYSFTP